MIIVRAQGTRIVEPRAICDNSTLENSIRRNFGSNRELASFLGVSETTARSYLLGKTSVPLSLFQRLNAIDSDLRLLEVKDQFGDKEKADRSHHIFCPLIERRR